MSRLERNIAYNVAGQGALLVLSLVSARYIARGLGQDVLGIIYLSLMLNTIVVAVLEMGICTTTVKEISANSDDPGYVVKIAQSGSLLYWAAYLCVALASVAVAPLIVEHWIAVESLPVADAVYMLRVLLASALLALPMSFYNSVFRGLQRMRTPNVVDVLTIAVQHAGTVALIATSRDVRLVAWWIAGVCAARVVLYGALVARRLGVRAVAPRLHWATLRRNRAFATQMFAVSLLGMVQAQSDKVLIATMMPVAQIGIYGLLYNAIARGRVLTNAVGQAALPAWSELLSAGRNSEAVAHYRMAQDLLCFGLAPVFALASFATLPLFAAVLDRETAAGLVVPGALLALGFYLNGTLSMLYHYSIAANRPEIGVRLNLYALLLTFPLTVVLTWRFGLVGAAGAWVCYQLFGFVYLVPTVSRHCLQRRARDWYAHIARVFALVGASYGLAAAGLWWALPPTLVNLALAYSCATLAFAAGAWRLAAVESRQAALRLAAQLLQRLRPARQSGAVQHERAACPPARAMADEAAGPPLSGRKTSSRRVVSS